MVPWSDKTEVRGPLKETVEGPDYLSEESKVLEANADRQQSKPFCELLLNRNSTCRKATRITIVLSKTKITILKRHLGEQMRTKKQLSGTK